MVTEVVNQGNELKLDANKPMFPISVVAGLLKVHQRTLRIYDAEQILNPTRTQKNRRLYSLNDIERGKFVQFLTRELGINIIGVKIISFLLNQLKVDPSKQIEHIAMVSHELNITPEIQQETREKLSKRGRRKVNPD